MSVRASSHVQLAAPPLNFGWVAVDNAGVDQVSRPMQIALVAVVLLAGMWFTVLKPKPDAGAPAPVAATPAADASSAPVAPGTKGLASAVDKAKAASATSDAANAKLQAATAAPSTAATAAKPAAAKAKAKASKPAAAARKPGTKAATAKAVAAKPAVTPATSVDPSKRLLAYLPKGKTLVVLFYGNGADDAAARKAVHRTALKDSKNVVSAYVPIGQVGRYDAITREVSVLTFPTVLVIGADRKATALSGFLDTRTIQQAVGDSRRDDAAAKKSSK
jgi:hypothetical protein